MTAPPDQRSCETIMTDMHFIKGAAIAGASGRSQNVYNPATGAVASSVPLASATEVDAAVAVAKAALPGWANTPPAKRAQVMFNFRDLIVKNLNAEIEHYLCTLC